VRRPDTLGSNCPAKAAEAAKEPAKAAKEEDEATDACP